MEDAQGDQDYAAYEYDNIGQMEYRALFNEDGTSEKWKFKYDVSGKIQEVLNADTEAKSLSYAYDDRGFRIRKVMNETPVADDEVYVRDASGSVLAIYKQNNDGSLSVSEHPIYGASRLGTYDHATNQNQYELKDHLGNVRSVITKVSGSINAIVQADYYPFGLKINIGPSGNYRYGYQGEFAEEDDETGFNHFEARDYDPVIGRAMVMDPARQFSSPYTRVGNNPISAIDPTGGISTNVDKDGNVVNVFDDGDLNIYRIDNQGNRTGEIIGQTKYWDEFINPETGLVQGFINEGAVWDNIVNTLHEDAKGLNLVTVALRSSPEGPYDIKHPNNNYTNNPFEGRLLNGYYATARSAGNFLAGYNGRTATSLFGKGGISLKAYMNVAGGLHRGLSATQAGIGTVLNNQSYGSPPYYRENKYAGRWILSGWFNNCNCNSLQYNGAF